MAIVCHCCQRGHHGNCDRNVEDNPEFCDCGPHLDLVFGQTYNREGKVVWLDELEEQDYIR